MPDTLLEFINPAIAIPLLSQEHPVLWMNRCLKTSREIEQMAAKMDKMIIDRDAKAAQARQEYDQQIADAERSLAQAGQRASEAAADLRDTIQNTLAPFEIVLYACNDHAVEESQNATALMQQLQNISNQASGYKKKMQTLRDLHTHGLAIVVACIVAVGSGVLAIIFGASRGSTEDGLVVFLILLSVLPACLIWKYIKHNQSFRGAADTLTSTAQQLLNFVEHARERSTVAAELQFEEKKQEATGQRDGALRRLQSEYDKQQNSQCQSIEALYISVSDAISGLNKGFVRGEWTDQAWEEWGPTNKVPRCLRIGILEPDTPRFNFHFPQFKPLAIPALVDYEAGKGVVIAAGGALAEGRQMAQSAILRLLATVPPASVRFVMVDPVSLGGNVAGFMALEKYEASLVGGKAWSDARHIEQALSEVTEHMETVIQKYLREDYKSIAEYNAKARVKEAYRVVVIFDFPVNFTEGSAKRLISIMRNGPRCGVFPIIVADDTKPLPYGVSWNDLTQFAMVLQPSDSPAAVLSDAVPASQATVLSGATPSEQGVVDDYYEDDEEDEDE